VATKKKVKRFDEGGETDVSSDSELLKKARALTDQRDSYVEWKPDGTGRIPVMDVSKVQDSTNVSPRWAQLDKNFTGAGARLTGTKKIDKDAMLQAYIDADVMRDKYQGTKGRVSGAGVRFTKNFAKGGKVLTASERADGIASRGKTRGRIV
jgi:hypothetical protein